jgi:hypothetical protein
VTKSDAALLFRIVGTCLALTAVAAAPASAEKTDRIHVAGIVIVGEVKSLEQGRLRISTDYMGTVEADWNQVTQVESKKFFEIETKDGTRYFGSIVASDEDRVLAARGDESTVHLPFSEVIRIDQTEMGFWGKVDGDIALGYSFVQATDTSQGSFSGNLSRRTGRFFSQLSLLSVLSETGDDRFTRNDASYTAERYLPGRWTYSLTGQLQTNESLGLDRRWLVRGGSLYRALRTDIRELTLAAGLAAVREYYTDDQPGENSWEGVLGLRYLAFHFDDPELEVTAEVLAYPSLSISHRWRTEFKADVSRELGWDLFWSLSAYWSLDNKPAVIGAENSDLAVTLSLGWKP